MLVTMFGAMALLAAAADGPPIDKGACGKLEWEIDHDLKQASFSSASSLPAQAGNYLTSATTNLNLMMAMKCPVIPAGAFAPDIYLKAATACAIAAIPSRSTKGLPECEQDKWQRDR